MSRANLQPLPVLHYILTYLYVLVAGAIALFCALVMRDTYRFVLINLELHRYTIHANVLMASVILVGIVCLVFLMVSEHYFRTAPNTYTQFIRFLRMVAYPLLLAGLAHLIHAGVGYGAHQQYVDVMRVSAGLAETLAGLLVGYLGFKGQSHRLLGVKVLARSPDIDPWG